MADLIPTSNNSNSDNSTDSELPKMIDPNDLVLTTVKILAITQNNEMIEHNDMNFISKGDQGLLIDLDMVGGSITMSTTKQLTGRILMEWDYYKSFNIFQYFTEQERLQRLIVLQSGQEVYAKRCIILSRQQVKQDEYKSRSGKWLLVSDLRNIEHWVVFEMPSK